MALTLLTREARVSTATTYDVIPEGKRPGRTGEAATIPAEVLEDLAGLQAGEYMTFGIVALPDTTGMSSEDAGKARVKAKTDLTRASGDWNKIQQKGIKVAEGVLPEFHFFVRTEVDNEGDAGRAVLRGGRPNSDSFADSNKEYRDYIAANPTS